MPARIVLVRDDPEALEEIAGAFRAAGHSIAAYTDPMLALAALETARTVQVLVSQADFAPGKPNGVALARMARLKRPGTHIVLIGPPGYEIHAAGLAEYIPLPVATPVLVTAVAALLGETERDPG
jgi:DNA-binding NtrC family response regulator